MTKPQLEVIFCDDVRQEVGQLHIEALDEGGYVATSEDIQGLVAQGRTVQETLQIAQDVARRLLEAQSERSQELPLKPKERCGRS